MTYALRIATLAGSTLVLCAGCIIKSSTTNEEPQKTTSTSSSSTSSGSGAAGAGGAGEGGAAQGGAGQGGGGGGPTCVSETGAGKTDAELCDSMNITPPAHGGGSKLCGPNFDQDPVGHAVCHAYHGIYAAGPWEHLAACLAEIGVQDACDDKPVLDCVSDMYATACQRPAIKEACEDWAKACADDPFDVDKCATDLNPFSDSGLGELTDCINSAAEGLSCQEAYDGCFESVTSV
ncbi:MAG: hypothetical protein HY744_22265 [Deltaproteobacteria bacterium]|nr:hypothetical protein [Deltaproteobacteria bacterium]